MKTKLKLMALALTAVLAGLATGCVDTADGRSKAGVPFVKDSVERKFNVSVPEVLAAARAVMTGNGVLTADNSVNNSLEGKVNQRNVWMRVDKDADEKDSSKVVSKLTVQARTTAGGADRDLAFFLEEQVAVKLATSR